MKEKFDLVILFCPGELGSDGVFQELNKNKQGDEEYLGGQTRMDAALDYAENTRAYVLVGGSEKEVNDMKEYLERSSPNAQEMPALIRIVSSPVSLGNLWAVKKVFSEKKDPGFLLGKRIGLMTNAYHMLRVMRNAADIFRDSKINFVPLVSEVVLTRYAPTTSHYPKEFSRRLEGEIAGLKDWEKGTYERQHDGEEVWIAQCLDEKELHQVR